MSSDSPIITFYDIAPGPPLRSFAPNPCKIRYALNHKRIAYRTQWTDMPDITSLRESLGLPANRTHADGTPFHTLPVIQDHSTGKVIGDGFEIALYLDKTYPSGPALFHPHTEGLTAALNMQVDAVFTKHVALCDRTAFSGHPREKEIQAVFAKRFGAAKWEDLALPEEARAEMFTSFENALGEFVKAYRHTGGTTDWYFRPAGTAEAQKQVAGREEGGVYLDGDEPVYADFIVGAWLAMFEASIRTEDWEKIRGWNGGFWGRLHDALEPLRKVV